MKLQPPVIHLVVKTAVRRVKQDIIWASAPVGNATEVAQSYIKEILTKMDALASLSAALDLFQQTWPRVWPAFGTETWSTADGHPEPDRSAGGTF